ncbi:MAG: sirohydrochlorin cobaltochelatase [Bacteroides pyogenes]|uniref:Cobalt chelatase n=1 Tax=Bacteroides pyogenes F0041 TaxID=1321819 RepID=U2CL94_9BACE|nr:sirohydrochlorin cobaltochelatase [Bacteroides pyogenes]ERI85305.1 cobalt chelatase [Bacteroides pyogenes F0041]MBB3895488.1 sirohydrochlorin cobaltochelatase [Bacteroides pyogenes]MBR8704994.1 Sirohydrochlorin cobaltochelatase [Bacteroides pyogenes]MCI7069937.1 sirohydrochlorin cobaltochelatase [Bacteroides pyogenes]SUV32872.1 heme-binding protein FetB, cobalt chelatase [Bacteroides pyogenes]
MKRKHFLLAACMLVCGALCLSSCGDDDGKGSTSNPVESVVMESKKSDTAILLCTFGSTFEESIKTYDAIIKDYKTTFPNTDVYLSFTSHTCVNRVKAATKIDRYQPDLWLRALGKAGYKRVAVQSLHVIPGEEYLSLMNTYVKKEFMISRYPKVKVLKSENLLSEDDDSEKVAKVLYDAYKKQLDDKKNIVLFMGHGNPDKSYAPANTKYTDLEKEMHELAANKNVFVGTVDYGDMLFFPEVEEGDNAPEDEKVPDTYIYKKLKNYCSKNNLQPSDITIYLASVMSIAGDHAHNDMWGLEDDDKKVGEATPYSEFSWRLKLQKMGFKIDMTESHHGETGKCTIKGLGDYPAIRAIWLDHLKKKYNDEGAWETGEDYQ